MQILLINDNSSVSKLINLTAKKYDYSIEEISDIADLKEGHKDIVFIDDAISQNLDIDLLKEKTGCDEFVYIASKGSQAPQGYKYTLTKPFLPSDFQNIIETIIDINKTIDEDTSVEEITQEIEDFIEKKEEFALDELETHKVKDEIVENENMHNNNEQTIEMDNEEEQSYKESLDEEDEDELSLEEDLFIDDEDSIKGISEDDILLDDISQSSDDISTTILDKEEIEEVKELLDENEDDDIDTTILHSTKENFDISDFEEDEADVDDFSLQKNEDEEELSESPSNEMIDSIEPEKIEKNDDLGDIVFEDDKIKEDTTIEKQDDEKDTIMIEDIQLADEENENLKEIIDSKEDESEKINEENNIENKSVVKSTEELDLIDEQSLKELFGQNSNGEETKEISNNEEDMEIESFEEIKPKKKKKKKKKLKKKDLSSLQEEITSKLLDIDTLREVLDGMEIRIKFYNKK